MAAVIRPIGVDHADLGDGGVAIPRAGSNPGRRRMSSRSMARPYFCDKLVQFLLVQLGEAFQGLHRLRGRRTATCRVFNARPASASRLSTGLMTIASPGLVQLLRGEMSPSSSIDAWRCARWAARPGSTSWMHWAQESARWSYWPGRYSVASTGPQSSGQGFISVCPAGARKRRCRCS